MVQSTTLDAATAKALTPAEARAIAQEAYIYGVPMVSIYGTLHAFSVDKGGREYKGPFNSVLNVARVFTPDDTAFVTPNSDTPYTFMGPDLRAEPMIITVPPIESGRYFVFQLMDLYTFNFDYIGTRATGNGGGTFMLAGLDWNGEVPKGITRLIRCETEMINVVGRTQLSNPGDLDNVKAIQAGYKLQPLSTFLGQPAPPRPPQLNWVKPVPPAEQRTSLDFFNVLSFVLQLAPTHPSEVALRERFTRIGIVPGQTFDPGALSAETQAALKAGMADGQQEIDARRTSLGGRSDALFGTREFLKNDYVTRAVGTQVGIGANSREEALYPIYEHDADGQPLDGSKAKYRLRFVGGAFPPVNAFWSLTMYDKRTQLLVANPIDRYLINSPMLPDMKLDADGGLTIHIQDETPGGDAEANWLPAPKGPFMLAMRYYLPKPELLSGAWTSPAAERASG